MQPPVPRPRKQDVVSVNHTTTTTTRPNQTKLLLSDFEAGLLSLPSLSSIGTLKTKLFNYEADRWLLEQLLSYTCEWLLSYIMRYMLQVTDACAGGQLKRQKANALEICCWKRQTLRKIVTNPSFNCFLL